MMLMCDWIEGRPGDIKDAAEEVDVPPEHRPAPPAPPPLPLPPTGQLPFPMPLPLPVPIPLPLYPANAYTPLYFPAARGYIPLSTAQHTVNYGASAMKMLAQEYTPFNSYKLRNKQ